MRQVEHGGIARRVGQARVRVEPPAAAVNLDAERGQARRVEQEGDPQDVALDRIALQVELDRVAMLSVPGARVGGAGVERVPVHRRGALPDHEDGVARIVRGARELRGGLVEVADLPEENGLRSSCAAA
jgi:hypothetical protein